MSGLRGFPTFGGGCATASYCGTNNCGTPDLIIVDELVVRDSFKCNRTTIGAPGVLSTTPNSLNVEGDVVCSHLNVVSTAIFGGLEQGVVISTADSAAANHPSLTVSGQSGSSVLLTDQIVNVGNGAVVLSQDGYVTAETFVSVGSGSVLLQDGNITAAQSVQVGGAESPNVSLDVSGTITLNDGTNTATITPASLDLSGQDSSVSTSSLLVSQQINMANGTFIVNADQSTGMSSISMATPLEGENLLIAGGIGITTFGGWPTIQIGTAEGGISLNARLMSPLAGVSSFIDMPNGNMTIGGDINGITGKLIVENLVQACSDVAMPEGFIQPSNSLATTNVLTTNITPLFANQTITTFGSMAFQNPTIPEDQISITLNQLDTGAQNITVGNPAVNSNPYVSLTSTPSLPGSKNSEVLAVDGHVHATSVNNATEGYVLADKYIQVSGTPDTFTADHMGAISLAKNEAGTAGVIQAWTGSANVSLARSVVVLQNYSGPLIPGPVSETSAKALLAANALLPTTFATATLKGSLTLTFATFDSHSQVLLYLSNGENNTPGDSYIDIQIPRTEPVMNVALEGSLYYSGPLTNTVYLVARGFDSVGGAEITSIQFQGSGFFDVTAPYVQMLSSS